ncbi:MAG: NUDIX domain-containing protein [Alphaproteobacteria bacterium]|nr:NUDIX domain-containing protein [Alphaproteobacteria bacterium]MCY4319739.1 NUDIX domain-containing protein [Alphaproteobacteria bacterium]
MRPRDAATLILYRRKAEDIEVLMGRRSSRHAFMPNTFVFPGGRVDPEDGRVVPLADLRAPVLERLQRNATVRRSRALGLAAIREAFEETGLAVGGPHGGAAYMDRIPDSWRPFYETGLAPRLDVLDYVFRAITPRGDVRRFHARFFLADGCHARGELGGSGELQDLQWIAIDRAVAMPATPGVTARALEEVRRRKTGALAGESAPPVPLYHGTRYGDRVRLDP